MELIPVTWTLCVEAAFYVVLPLIGLLALRIGARPKAAGRDARRARALATAWNRVVVDQGWNDDVQKALPTFMGVFACGMLAALWVETRKRDDKPILSAR